MDDGSFTTTISAAGLAPSQRRQLEADLRSEGIPVTWAGDALQVDQAFESRIETLVATARSVPAGDGPGGPAPGRAPAAGFVPTATIPPPAPPPYPGPPYPAAGYPPMPYVPAYPRITNSNATLSLVLGIVAWLVCPVTAIFAIIYGRRAQDEIDASGGTQTGDGMAKAGIVLGWVLVGLYGLMIVGFVVFVLLFGIIGVAASAT